MNWNDFCLRYSTNISNEKFTDIRYIVKLAFQTLGIDQNSMYPALYPLRPLLADIALLSKRGCSSYYKLICKKGWLQNKIYLRDEKWHAELGCMLSIDFWSKSRKLCADICFENNLKWMQYQIVRNSLQTNYIVSHFKRSVSSLCEFCRDEDELVSHLYWNCHVVQSFIEEVREFFRQREVVFQPEKLQFLFGFQNLPILHPHNYLTLIIKKYIWTTKFKAKNLNITGFVSFAYNYVSDLVYILEKKQEKIINEWEAVIFALTDF